MRAARPADGERSCCSCYKLRDSTGYLSCIDVDSGTIPAGCRCKGQCPPGRCKLEHCVSHFAAGNSSRRTRSARPASFSSSSSTDSAFSSTFDAADPQFWADEQQQQQ